MVPAQPAGVPVEELGAAPAFCRRQPSVRSHGADQQETSHEILLN